MNVLFEKNHLKKKIKIINIQIHISIFIVIKKILCKNIESFFHFNYAMSNNERLIFNVIFENDQIKTLKNEKHDKYNKNL